MYKQTKKAISNKKQIDEILSFINLGFKDYLGARTLLNNKLTLQGAILASTSVEKYFKAIISYRGNTCTGHLKKKHINSIKNFDSKLYNSLNQSFLEFLIKCYELRYFDSVEPQFNLVISTKKVLSELDYTISEIHKRFQITRNGTKVPLPYDAYLTANSPLLYNNNYLLQKMTKVQFIQQRDPIYEIRINSNLGILEVYYETDESQDDGDFLKEGLVST